MFNEDVSPDTTVFGSGEAQSAVVGSVHGDEPTGVRAIHRVLETSPTFEQPVKFIVANPPAAVAHRRFLDEDMNRVFPGDPDADSRERRLAAQLVTETAGLPTLSIHTTHATTDPVAFITSDNPRALEIADELPIRYVVNEQPVVDSAFSSTDGVISVEAGKPEQHSATEKAVRIIEAFLRITGIVDGLAETRSNTEYFVSNDTVEKPASADSYELLVENFEQVEAGTAYAKTEEETLVADESFVPILMSETGYDEMFGYKGRKISDSLDDARDMWIDED